jgi:hypothetical protein
MIKTPGFVRQNEQDKVFAVINFSGETQAVTFTDSLFHGSYVDYFSSQTAEMTSTTRLTLKPWGYQVFVQD